jgi:hypothetical protein
MPLVWGVVLVLDAIDVPGNEVLLELRCALTIGLAARPTDGGRVGVFDIASSMRSLMVSNVILNF